MFNKIDESFRPAIVAPTGDDHRRLLNLMYADRGPVLIPAMIHHDPLPFTPGFDDMNFTNPLHHTPIAITRSVNQTSRRSNLTLAMTVALLSTSTNFRDTSFRITGTGGLKERLKSLEKNLQRNPTRNDIKLQIMELRNQIREIEAQNAKARKAQQAAKVKKRK